MTLVAGTNLLGVYHANDSQVQIDEIVYDIIAENDDYIALFRRGRSVYKPQIGSEYEPAKLFLCEILGKNRIDHTDRDSTIQLLVLLESPIRRN